jgi:predicted nuclease of predicted toxin-antitoxin system
LSLKLLVDEDSQGKILVALLRKAGHDVLTVNTAGLRTASDSTIFNYAIAHKRTVLTHNCLDFTEIASTVLQQGKHHHGLLLVYKDNNTHKDMNASTIARAIRNLLKSRLKLKDLTIALNQYVY